MNTAGKYFDGVAELVKTGNRFETRNARKLPRHGNIFNFTRFRDASGTELMAVLDEDGSLLKEVWHTRQTPSYLADYAYDPASREVMLLEVVQRSGLFGKGKTTISINRID